MATQKITGDSNLASPDLADLIPIVDISEPNVTKNKTITWAQIKTAWSSLDEDDFVTKPELADDDGDVVVNGGYF